MGLKLSDALRLSWANIIKYKKRSAIIILTISLLFGVTMGLNFITTGLEETVISASAAKTDGAVYIRANYYSPNSHFYDGTTIYNPEEILPDMLEPVIVKSADEKVRTRATEYGGEIIGYYWYYQLDEPYQVVTKSAVGHLIDPYLWSTLPEDKIPAILSESWNPLATNENNSLYRVGNAPSTEAKTPILDGFNPLNMILSQLPKTTDNQFWLVDDGSGKIETYIEEQLRARLTEEGGWYHATTIQKIAIVKFDDPYKAAEFASPDEKKFGVAFYNNFTYDFQDLLGTTILVVNAFNVQRAFLIAAEILLLVVATLIATITFAHLIDQDATTVALYRAMGASTGDIYLIYLLYLIELCLLAIAATILIAFIFVVFMALTSANTLATRLQSFYHLSYLPKVTLFKFNETFYFIISAILAVAPLSLLFTLRRFSAKHIAKKLKED